MKSATPSLGVRVPDVRRTAKAVAAAHPFETAEDLRSTVLVLWREARYREERYAAIDVTGLRSVAGDPLMLPVYEEFIRRGSSWDYVDGVVR
jgi:hypothetical protein